MNKAARIVINYCLDNDIGILVVGYNKTFQKDSYISKSKNQNFVDIPYEMLQDKLEYLFKSNDIILVMQEKSYTSKASFWDKNKKYHFIGKRIHCGQYITADRHILNADVTDALNILSTSNVMATSFLYDRGDIDMQ